jgi:hypothetical protein
MQESGILVEVNASQAQADRTIDMHCKEISCRKSADSQHVGRSHLCGAAGGHVGRDGCHRQQD